MAKAIKCKQNYKTDNKIPKFGYKSSFIILICTFLSVFIVPYICNILSFDYHMPTVIIGGLCAGFSAVYTQFFIERKKGFSKNFFIVGGLLSLFSGLIIFLVVYAGIII